MTIFLCSLVKKGGGWAKPKNGEAIFGRGVGDVV